MSTERGRRGHWRILCRQQQCWLEEVVKRRGSQLPCCWFGSYTLLRRFQGQSCLRFGKISQPITLEQWNEVNFWDSIRHAALIGRQRPLVWCCYSGRIEHRDIIGLGKSRKFQWSWWSSKTENENTGLCTLPPYCENQEQNRKKATSVLGFSFLFWLFFFLFVLSHVLTEYTPKLMYAFSVWQVCDLILVLSSSS